MKRAKMSPSTANGTPKMKTLRVGGRGQRWTTADRGRNVHAHLKTLDVGADDGGNLLGGQTGVDGDGGLPDDLEGGVGSECGYAFVELAGESGLRNGEADRAAEELAEGSHAGSLTEETRSVAELDLHGKQRVLHSCEAAREVSA